VILRGEKGHPLSGQQVVRTGLASLHAKECDLGTPGHHMSHRLTSMKANLFRINLFNNVILFIGIFAAQSYLVSQVVVAFSI
jgi:hypothetical protein